MQKNTIYKIKDLLTLIITVSTVVGLGITVLNFLILNRIQPLSDSLETLTKEVYAVEEEHKGFVKNDVFSESQRRQDEANASIIHRLDLISGRLDKLLLK